MHCASCNEFLSDEEAKVKTLSGAYLNLCLNCYKPISDDIELDPMTVPKGWFYVSQAVSDEEEDYADDEGYDDFWEER